ncbi:MAG: glycosyltransferase family 4 protein [Candidatus Nanopelagicales bacterium]
MTGRPRRVALVLATSTGGVGQHVRMLTSGLRANGDVVAVLGPQATEDLFGFRQAGAAFAPVEIAAGPEPIADTRALLRLRRLVRNADVVHAHGLRAGLLTAVALRLLPRRPALVVTLHNLVLDGGRRARAYEILEPIVVRHADVVLGVSADIEERARGSGGRDVRHGFVPAPPLPPPTRTPEQVRRELGAQSRPLVVVVARLHPQKGYPVLLDAAADWATRDPKPLVVAAGSGPAHEELAARIDAERLPVKLLGHRADVADLLAAADVVVLPSQWEGQPLTVQETLRAGVPLVATAVGGVPAMVGDAAMLVPYADAAALAVAVSRVLDDDDLRRSLGEHGRAQALSWPTEAQTVEQVSALYDEVLTA